MEVQNKMKTLFENKNFIHSIPTIPTIPAIKTLPNGLPEMEIFRDDYYSSINSMEENNMSDNILNIAEIKREIGEIQKNSDSGKQTQNEYGEGIVLIKNFSQGTTSNGNPKYDGIFVNIDEIKFHVWNNTAAYDYLENLSSNCIQSQVVSVKYELSKYGMIVKDFEAIEGIDPESFIYHKYSIEDLGKEFAETLKAGNLSVDGETVLAEVLHMHENDEVNYRFGREQAANSHHDNCPTGLLAHTTKCIKIYNGVKGAYPFLSDERANDLMIIGLAIHDVGKIYEMKDGVYQGTSFITHRGLGYEHLLKHKSIIVELYDEEFFYMLASVILQHHGEYGENPKTLYAYLVHMIDDMEAQLTSIDDILQEGTISTDEAGTKIKFNNIYLNILNN